MSNDNNLRLPIDFLREDMLNYVQSYIPNFNEALIDSIRFGGLDEYINYNISSRPITDVAYIDDLPTGKNRITFYNNFLQFLWCICYSFMVFNDQHRKRRMIGIFDEEELTQAFKVFSSGMSLFKSYNPKIFYDLPNPTVINTNDDNLYISKSSSLFLNAFSFILSHEFSHHYLGHLENENSVYSESQLIADELKADKVAISILLNSTDEHRNWNLKIGIITALCSLIFLDNTLKGDNTHPDPDDRLKVMMENLKLDEFDGLWGWASLFFIIWSQYYGMPIEIEVKQKNDFHTFWYIYEICQKRKKNL